MMVPSTTHAIERNVRLYPLYQGLFNAYFWMPVFFLFFSEHLPLSRVLQLEAIYYAAVVLMEVPSGYFSDRVGRRPTLLISTSAMVIAYGLFFLGRSFEIFAIAQICLATGFSFNSGTDTALHYDSLSGLGRADEYADREAKAHRNALLGRALAALAGGLAANWQLHYAYGLSLLAALATLGVVLFLREPPVHDETLTAGRNFLSQLGASLGQLRNRSLAWLFGFALLMTVINHVPYEFYQPYLDLLVEDRGVKLPGQGTPLLTGVLTALMMVLAAWGTAHSIRLRNRIGLASTLMLTTGMQVVIMAAMGLWLHEVVVILILLRSIPAGMMKPPLHAAITPQLPQSLRATYLSMQSLAGRLSFSGVLAALSLVVEPESHADWPALSLMSLACAGLGALGFIILVATARQCLHSLRPAPEPVPVPTDEDVP